MNITIKRKLFLGFSVILIIIIGLAVFMGRKLSETNQKLGTVVEISSKRVSYSKEVLIGVLEAGRHEKNIILEKDRVKKEFFRDKVNQSLDRINLIMPDLYELLDPGGQNLLNDFMKSWNIYKENLDRIISFSMLNNQDSAYSISIEKGMKVRDEAVTLMTRLIDKNEREMLREKEESDREYRSSLSLIIVLILSSLAISVTLAYWIIYGITRRIAFIAHEAGKIASREFSDAKPSDIAADEMSPIFDSLIDINDSFKEVTESANSVADGDYTVDFRPRSELDVLGNALRMMTVSLRDTTAENERHSWLTTGQNLLNEKLRGDQSTRQLCSTVISFLSEYVNANAGAIYLAEDNKRLILAAGFAFSSDENSKVFAFGDGLVGEAAVQKKNIFLDDVRDEDLRVASAFVDTRPRHILACPFLFEDKTLGVIELGKLSGFTEAERTFIQSSLESIGININSAIARYKIAQLLEETQAQSEELQSQQEELRQMNEELEEQAQNLKQQQEELQMTNEELEEQTQTLETRNSEIESARHNIEQKTKQLEMSSRYKSEFLANMSHELRTPLNSLLILSEDLAENRKKNLTKEQVESAQIINRSGHDLLTLINDVLDLSKIEAGKMSLNVEELTMREFLGNLLREFRYQAERKGLKFSVTAENDSPELIHTDIQRLNQIMKNLLSNAIKFTEKGSIGVNIRANGPNEISISVSDTGIGIPADKQMAIFEAFQQADGGTSRKYGGTGLGLSISRELARLLQGEITISSAVGEGSVFTLTIPVEISPDESAPAPRPVRNEIARRKSAGAGGYVNYPTIKDDREEIRDGDKIVLVIEDDLKLAGVLKREANSKEFKCLAASTGEDGLTLALNYKPNAILLDLELPGIDGHQVLAELKATPAVRHIPVHIISVNERTIDTIKEGAVEYLTKPVNKKQLEEAFTRIENFINRKMKNLLIIEDDENSRKAIRRLIGNGDVNCFEAGSGSEAMEVFKNNHVDCIVLDIKLPDITGFDLIKNLRDVKDRLPPVIIYTGKDLTREENAELQKYAETIIIKGAKSEERLLDETALFLHRTISGLPETKQRIINNLYDKEKIFHSRKILIVDDDMRNVFALSKVHSERGVDVLKAENGVIALETLRTNPDVDLVLMDIMMPEMDGYETMRKIRSQPKFRNLPLIALTAKAMKEDKQKCIDAGANDYISKPVDVDRLLTLMRVWLSK